MKSRSFIPTLAIVLGACSSQPGEIVNETGPAAEATSAAPIALGQTGSAEGVQITLNEVETLSSIGPADLGLNTQPGETFVVVRYAMKNTSTQPLEFTERPALSLVDGNGQAYSSDDIASVMIAVDVDANGLTADLNPNVSARTATVWKVDRQAFNPATWKVTASTDPTLTFALR